MTSLFPAWVLHQRMGHKQNIGFAHQFNPETILLTTPAMPEDGELEGTPESRHVLPVGGPGFYGLQILTEEEAKAMLRLRQPRKFRPFAPPPMIEMVDGDEDEDGVPV